MGLASAQAIQNVSGIEWACVGVLSQAWTKDQKHVEANARRIAQATYESLKSAGDAEVAERFLSAIREAQIRDCYVKITWTGDADIDLVMKEPSGSICSIQSPRSEGGGVLVGDSFSRVGEKSVEGTSEVYVCPQGYSGEYHLLLKRVWGKVTSGKVTVHIVKHAGTDKEEVIHENIPLSDVALVKFDIQDGRRAEPLAIARVENVAKAQLNANRALLAQQLGAAESSMATRDWNAANQRAVAGGRRPGFNRAGPVGFMPRIQQFPEGQQMDAMAIISADRRYVRFTLMGTRPISSSITEVNTFNFVTGQGGTQGGAGGGIGGGGGGIGGGGGGVF